MKKYAAYILKKIKMEACMLMLTPVRKRLKLVKDGNDDLVNATNFKRLIGTLKYLITTKPNIVHGIEIISKFMDSP